ncbi:MULTISPECIES: hypothetical protein [unclassified Streptomyces]|uniref:hypothetical protein n=1 Tax=unclassified Streptomyces TaxID=2593676 RepID=UPI001319C43F|nr:MULTISPECIES: hypothetical protein [unclassified Streptomyces]MYT30740.1 hypothetical protein [Streptomyces sp. SID8354]
MNTPPPASAPAPPDGWTVTPPSRCPAPKVSSRHPSSADANTTINTSTTKTSNGRTRCTSRRTRPSRHPSPRDTPRIPPVDGVPLRGPDADPDPAPAPVPGRRCHPNARPIRRFQYTSR